MSCELPGDKMGRATKPVVIDLSKLDPAKALRMVTAVVMPTLPDALKEQAQRDFEAAIQGNRPKVEERAENDGAQP